jgi:hypothetical protein
MPSEEAVFWDREPIEVAVIAIIVRSWGCLSAERLTAER